MNSLDAGSAHPLAPVVLSAFTEAEPSHDARSIAPRLVGDAWPTGPGAKSLLFAYRSIAHHVLAHLFYKGILAKNGPRYHLAKGDTAR